MKYNEVGCPKRTHEHIINILIYDLFWTRQSHVVCFFLCWTLLGRAMVPTRCFGLTSWCPMEIQIVWAFGICALVPEFATPRWSQQRSLVAAAVGFNVAGGNRRWLTCVIVLLVVDGSEGTSLNLPQFLGNPVPCPSSRFSFTKAGWEYSKCFRGWG